MPGRIAHRRRLARYMKPAATYRRHRRAACAIRELTRSPSSRVAGSALAKCGESWRSPRMRQRRLRRNGACLARLKRIEKAYVPSAASEEALNGVRPVEIGAA